MTRPTAAQRPRPADAIPGIGWIGSTYLYALGGRIRPWAIGGSDRLLHAHPSPDALRPGRVQRANHDEREQGEGEQDPPHGDASISSSIIAAFTTLGRLGGCGPRSEVLPRTAVHSGAVAAPAEATTLGRTARELAARANEAHALSSLSAGALARWLISRGLAEPRAPLGLPARNSRQAPTRNQDRSLTLQRVARGGGNITSDGRVIQALIILLAAREQTRRRT
jgi:hypothetical protein